MNRIEEYFRNVIIGFLLMILLIMLLVGLILTLLIPKINIAYIDMIMQLMNYKEVA